MGEVYRAKDTKLGREVALKILPASFTNEPERVARFRREAQVLATLNHPHIAQIHGLEEVDSTQFLVLELVDGESLDKWIARGPIPLDETLGIARQIAEALEAAQEKGVIHRDLKPANVAVTGDGNVKVLDFGLAKAVDLTGGSLDAMNSPTITSPAMMTSVGVILGTAAYMSPEQAKGRAADKRSDVWAFGCLLYEMLTGRRAFDGEDVSDTLAAVLRGEPDWVALPPVVPPAIRALIRGCLEKDRRQRIADISTFLFVIKDPGMATRPAGPPPVPHRGRWNSLLSIAATVLVVGALSSLVTWRLKPTVPGTVVRFPMTLSEGQTISPLSHQPIAISPDGTQAAYVANNRLFLRTLSELEARPIPGTDGIAVVGPRSLVDNVAFSPDGQWLAFSAGGALRKIRLTGGRTDTLCPADAGPLGVIGVSWYREGIVFGEGPNGIMRVSPNGGRPESLAAVKEGENAYFPEMLPDGQTLLFTVLTGADGSTARGVAQSLKARERRIVIEHGADARYVPTGHLVYSSGGTVFAAPFDSRRLLVTSGAVPVVEGVRSSFSVSATGTLIYLSGPMPAAAGQMDLGFVSRTGVVEPLKLPPRPYEYPRVSPDGQRVVFDTNDDTGAIVSIYDLAGTTGIRRLTYGGRNRFPIWSPNGQRVTFQSDRNGDAGLFWQLADGTGPAERLTKADAGSAHVPESWSPDGEHLLYSVTKGARVSLWILSIKEKTAAPFETGTYAEPTTAVFSPDGHFVAYAGAEVQGRGTVYVQPFPPTSAKYQLPTAPGDNPHHPLWSPDGKELFYIPRPLGFEVVAVSTSPTFAFGRPVALPRAFPTAGPTTPRIFDVTPDGRFISMVLPGPVQSAPFSSQIVVVVNWLDEVKARMTMK